MPKVSPEHAEARRRQILDGAQRCFAKHGYAGGTVARLEEEIGLSRGAIFNYFGSKQDLFVALSVDVNRRYGELVAEGGLESAVRAMANEDPDLIAVLLEAQALLRHDPEFVRALEAAHEANPSRIPDWFAAGQAAGTFRDDIPARELARFATMVVNGLGLRVAAGDETDVDAVLRLLHDALAPRE